MAAGATYKTGNVISSLAIVFMIVFNISLWRNSGNDSRERDSEAARYTPRERRTSLSGLGNGLVTQRGHVPDHVASSLAELYDVEPSVKYWDFPNKTTHPLLVERRSPLNIAPGSGLADLDSLEKELKVLSKAFTFNKQPDPYLEIFSNILAESAKTRAPLPDSYTELRKNYQVPKIRYPRFATCSKLLKGDKEELAKAEKAQKDNQKVPVADGRYTEMLKDCEAFKKDRGYVQVPLTQEEEDYPLAFSIAMYRDIEQAERLLRAVYQPQNLYCIHIDDKSPLRLHMTMYRLAGCFHNVFIASHLDRVKWGDVSVLLPAMNCMRDMVKYHRGKWKYFINLTGQEMPLRTNWELVQIAKIFNGSNDIGGSRFRIEIDRVNFKWTHKYNPKYVKTAVINSWDPKETNPWNLTFYKGELHGLFSRKMVEYIIENKLALDYLDWCWDTGHPTEHFWNTLNYNQHLKPPGGYEGPDILAHEYSLMQVSRAKHWTHANYGSRQCRGKTIRGICVYGVGDLPWLDTRPELVANKFHLTFQYLAFDCLEEKHRNRTILKDKVPFDPTYYKELPTVKYSRKDGL